MAKKSLKVNALVHKNSAHVNIIVAPVVDVLTAFSVNSEFAVFAYVN